jgi:glycopeptide antibiotics resistance protein
MTDPSLAERLDLPGGGFARPLLSESSRNASGVTPSRGRIVAGALWVGWIALTVAVVVPWGDFQGHTHWRKVAWIPFVSPPVRMTDVVGNVLLYVPFGYGYRRLFRNRSTIWPGMLLAATLSLATEATQLYSHWRFPSATDVSANLLGALCGLYVGQRGARLIRGEFRVKNRS